MKRSVPRLHVITDDILQDRFSHAELARLAIDGGADAIQFRQKAGSTRDALRKAEPARDVCREAGVTFIVNDRLDVALAVEADGLHVGQEDLPAGTARRLIGPDLLLGVSAHTAPLAEMAQSDGADYIGFGPVYGTASKETARSATGIRALNDLVGSVRVPVVAIGGIRSSNVGELLVAGARGVAVISAICLAEDVTEATAAFAKQLRSEC